MTGPEHYREAEQLLSLAADYDKDGAPQTAARCRVEAQVHATLALAAATVTAADVAAAAGDVGSRGLDRWHDALAPQPVKDEDVEDDEDRGVQ